MERLTVNTTRKQCWWPMGGINVENETTKEKYVIIRANTAGCFAGYLVSQKGDVVTLRDSRRLWYWEGAASLSQLAQSGTTKPSKCKFPEAVAEHQILGVIEILTVTDGAKGTIEAVPVWRS